MSAELPQQRPERQDLRDAGIALVARKGGAIDKLAESLGLVRLLCQRIRRILWIVVLRGHPDAPA